MLPHDWPCSPPHSNALHYQTLKRVAAEVFQKWVSVIFANTGTGYARGEFLSTVDVPMGRFTVRRKPRLPAAAFIGRRRPRDALHCTPGTEALCGGVHRSSPIPWRASLCAGDGGAMRWRSSIADDPRARFTVRRGRRRCAAVFIDRRRSHGALHCTPGAQAFCTGARKILAFWRGSDAHGFYNLGNPLRSGACNP